jgi:hypothetical protein
MLAGINRSNELQEDLDTELCKQLIQLFLVIHTHGLLNGNGKLIDSTIC